MIFKSSNDMSVRGYTRCLFKKRWSILVICIVFIFIYANMRVLPLRPEPQEQKPSEISNFHKVLDNKKYQKDVHTASKEIRMETEKPDNISPKDVLVNVNDKTTFTGLLIDNNLYVPFNFLAKYYEVRGTYAKEVSGKLPYEFYWSHTDLSVLDPSKLAYRPYSVDKWYLDFQSSNVARRSRVKCICGQYEVPITTQWDPEGYYYPTQIAQYGLNHLSKFYAERSPIKTKKFQLSKGETGLQKIKFSETVNKTTILKVSLKSKLTPFEVEILASDKNIYYLKYVLDNTKIQRGDSGTIIHGIGTILRRKKITRDLTVDLIKGLSYIDGKKEGKTARIKIKTILSITFVNHEFIEAAELVSEDHEAKFLAAADWFIQNQNEVGGWQTHIPRIVSKKLKMDSGWHNAMAQGQAMSLLCRVYRFTGDIAYLNAALNAVKVFKISSKENGVLAMLFDKYPWYEEYPTTPSMYVLNGFIYSLFGLYDLYNTAPIAKSKTAKMLFEQGLKSLEDLLPLFDNGHGSYYDLRHISIPGETPNIARWQYHKTHLEQLDALIYITKSTSIKQTYDRWIEYAKGVRAKHN